MLQWMLGRFDLKKNVFKVKLSKNQIEEAPLMPLFPRGMGEQMRRHL